MLSKACIGFKITFHLNSCAVNLLRIQLIYSEYCLIYLGGTKKYCLGLSQVFPGGLPNACEKFLPRQGKNCSLARCFEKNLARASWGSNCVFQPEEFLQDPTPSPHTSPNKVSTKRTPSLKKEPYLIRHSSLPLGGNHFVTYASWVWISQADWFRVVALKI